MSLSERTYYQDLGLNIFRETGSNSNRIDRPNPFIRKKDNEPIKAMRVELYSADAPLSAIKSDLISFLGEYRAGIEIFHYDLIFRDDKLRSPHDNEPMITKAEKSRDETIYLHPHKIPRRHAELRQVKIEERIVRSLQEGDTYFYFSPPDAGGDEGNYGFAFIGTVQKQGEDKIVNKQAIKIALKDLDSYQEALGLMFRFANELNGNSYPEQTFEPVNESHDLIPQIVVFNGGVSEQEIFKVLFMSQLKHEQSTHKTERFYSILPILDPYINELALLIKSNPNSPDIQRAFNALQNLLDKLLNQDSIYYGSFGTNSFMANVIQGYASLLGMPPEYYHTPTVVQGSCGSSGVFSGGSSGGSPIEYITSTRSLVFSKNTEVEDIVCPKCGHRNPGGEGIEECRRCGYTKEQYAEDMKSKGGEICV